MNSVEKKYLIRVHWKSGTLTHSKFFLDKIEAQKLVMDLQKAGITPQVRQVEQGAEDEVV